MEKSKKSTRVLGEPTPPSLQVPFLPFQDGIFTHTEPNEIAAVRCSSLEPSGASALNPVEACRLHY